MENQALTRLKQFKAFYANRKRVYFHEIQKYFLFNNNTIV